MLIRIRLDAIVRCRFLARAARKEVGLLAESLSVPVRRDRALFPGKD